VAKDCPPIELRAANNIAHGEGVIGLPLKIAAAANGGGNLVA
jgi:hypothetical protein